MARIPDVADELYYETDATAVLHSADLIRDETFPTVMLDEVPSVLDNDSDPDGGSLTVSAVEGSAAGVGTAVTLASGALVTMNADGTFDYDPNGAFDDLGFGEYAEDSFEYTVSGSRGGTAAATATVTVGGVGAFDSDLALIDFEDGGLPSDFVWSTNGASLNVRTVDLLESLNIWSSVVHTMLNQTGGDHLVVPDEFAGTTTVSVASADGSDFDFAGGWLGATKFQFPDDGAGQDPYPSYLTVSGYLDGVLVGSETAVVSIDQPAAFFALDLQGIDLLTFEHSGPESIVFDDLYMMT